MKKIKNIIIFIFLMILCFGCSGKNESLPDIDIPLSEMNHDIELVPDPGGSTIPKNDDFYGFQVRNLSDQVIVFQGDYGIKLYIKKEGKWEKIENRLHYPDGEVILPLTKDFPLGQYVTIIPYILDLNQKVTLRTVVIGHLENKPNQSIGAYTDIILNP